MSFFSFKHLSKNMNCHVCGIISLLLCGCANHNNSNLVLPMDSIQVPENWESVAIQANTSQTSLIQLPNELLSLINEALASNQDLAIAVARFAVSGADLKINQARQLPDIDFSFNSRREQKLSGLATDNIDKSYQNTFTGNLRFSWEVDLWQRIADQVNAAESDWQASKQDLINAKQSIISQVISTYLELAENSKLIENTQANYQSQLKRVSITERRLDSGLADSLDLRLAKNSLYNIRSNLAQQKFNFAKSQQKMNLLLGRYPGAEVNLQLESIHIPEFMLTISPSQVLKQRPDIRAAEARVASAFSRWQSSTKNNLPKVNLNANFRGSREEIEKLFDWQYWLAGVAADIVQPIFDGGAISADIEQKDARQQLAWAQYQDVVLNAWREIEQNLTAEYALAEKFTALEAAYQQIQASEILLNNQYEQGLASSFDLLTIQTRRMNTEIDKTRAQYAVLNNRVGLMLALGQPFLLSNDEK